MAPTIQEACAMTGENRERVMALAYRESWCTFAPGYNPKGSWVGWGDDPDGIGPKKAYAFGPFQIDRRYHGNFIAAELWRYSQNPEGYKPLGQALYACDLLRSAREYFKRSALYIQGENLERASYAAYNAGEGHVYRALIRRQDVDAATTGKNYSAYIFNLAKALAEPCRQWIWN